MILCFTIGTEKKILKDNQTFIAKPKSHMDTKKRFFDHLYHMFPFLDEFLFKDDISNIIGSESFDEHCINTLKVKKKNRFRSFRVVIDYFKVKNNIYLTYFGGKIIPKMNHLL